jgi:hypothetical protein
MGSTPVRKPHTNTSDLLTWSEVPPPQSSPAVSATRSRQVTIYSLFLFAFNLSLFQLSIIHSFIYCICLNHSRLIELARFLLVTNSLKKKLKLSPKGTFFLLSFFAKSQLITRIRSYAFLSFFLIFFDWF